MISLRKEGDLSPSLRPFGRFVSWQRHLFALDWRPSLKCVSGWRIRRFGFLRQEFPARREFAGNLWRRFSRVRRRTQPRKRPCPKGRCSPDRWDVQGVLQLPLRPLTRNGRSDRSSGGSRLDAEHLAIRVKNCTPKHNQPYLMAQLPDLAAPEMGIAAGFHRNDAGSSLPKEDQHVIPSRLLA